MRGSYHPLLFASHRGAVWLLSPGAHKRAFFAGAAGFPEAP